MHSQGLFVIQSHSFSVSGDIMRRWQKCIETITKTAMFGIVGSMYVDKYFREDAKAAALEMVANIREKVINSLDVSVGEENIIDGALGL